VASSCSAAATATRTAARTAADGGTGALSAAVLNPTGSHTLTEAKSDVVTMVEFLDYQCPACHAYYDNVTRKLEHDYAGRITFVTRNFPLDAHPLAVSAAQAAESAAKQGKYGEMYHALYDNYDSWALAPDGQNLSDDATRARAQFDTYAREIGLDLERFHRDQGSAELRQRIDRDRTDGDKAGVHSTPTIFVDGKQFEPSGQSFADVDRQLRALLDGALNR
jgi:protein-disulfide isomerase